MSNEVKFKISGNELTNYFERIKQKGNDLTNSFIENARKENAAAKEQLTFLEREIAALEKKNILASQIANKLAEGNVRERLANIPNRDNLLDVLFEKNRQKLNNKEIGQGQFNATENRLTALSNKNNPLNILGSYQEFLKKQNDGLREQVLSTKLAKEQITAIKDAAKENIRAVRDGDSSIEDVLEKAETPTQKLAAEVAKERIDKDRNNKEKTNKDETNSHVPKSGWLSFAKALAFDRSLSLAANIPNAKNEIDMIRPILSMAGVMAGGIAGNLIDMINVKFLGTGLGNTNFGALGTELGEKAGEFLGDSLSRSYKGRDELSVANYRLQALTGQNLNVQAIGAGKLGGTGKSDITANLSGYGADYLEGVKLQYEIAQKQGRGTNLGRNAENVLAAQQGLSISKEISYSLMELSRSTHENEGNFLRTLGGVLTASQNNILKGDRAFFGEFMSSYVNLTKNLLKTQDTVSSGQAFSILKEFNDVGGQFSARDPRSLGLIENVNSALVNPGTDNLKAAAFLAIKRANPNLQMYQVLEEQQKGLASSTYAKSIMGMIDGMGGDENQKILNYANAFGLSGNISAAERLYRNRKAIEDGTMNMGSLSVDAGNDESSLRKLGQDQTSYYSKSTAEIQNKFVDNVADAVEFVGVKMKDLFGDMTKQLTDYIKQQLSGAQGSVSTTPQTNAVKTARQASRAWYMPQSSQNGGDTW